MALSYANIPRDKEAREVGPKHDPLAPGKVYASEPPASNINIHSILSSLAGITNHSDMILDKLSIIHLSVKGELPIFPQPGERDFTKDGSLSQILSAVINIEMAIARTEMIISSLEESLLSQDEQPKKKGKPIESEDYITQKMS